MGVAAEFFSDFQPPAFERFDRLDRSRWRRCEDRPAGPGAGLGL